MREMEWTAIIFFGLLALAVGFVTLVSYGAESHRDARQAECEAGGFIFTHESRDYDGACWRPDGTRVLSFDANRFK